ncbi:MAG: TIGR02996 domain-containing protein [Kofleriaceae bacterium]
MIEHDFLTQILASPDDAPRLVYADWLEEQGNLERAQLIRAQCELAALPAWHPRAVTAAWEAEALLGWWGDRWRAELPAIEGIEWTEFERGFVSTVRVRDLRALYAHAASIAAAAPVSRVELAALDESQIPYERVPWLRTVRLTNGGEYVFHPAHSILTVAPALEIANLREYGDLAWASRARSAPLERLVLEGNHVASARVAQELVEHLPAGTLRQLALGTQFVDYDSGYFEDPTLGAEGARLIADRKFEALELLNLDRQRITTALLEPLLASMPHVRQLELRRCEIDSPSAFTEARGEPIVRLGLSYNELGDAGVKVIATAPRLAALESLELDTCELTADAVTALAASPAWQTLRVLDLGGNPLGIAGAAALTEVAAPGQLHTLRLANCDLGPDAVTLLAEIPWLRALAVLDLSANELGTQSRVLIERLASGALQRLALAKIALGAAEAPALRPLWERLVHLDLSHNALGDDGVAAVIGSGSSPLYSLELGSTQAGAGLDAVIRASLPRLHRLGLASCRPRPVLPALFASRLMATLRSLDLSACELDTGDAILIARTPATAQLRTLNLRGNDFDEEAILALATSEHLRSVALKLDTDLWRCSNPVREQLNERFGVDWELHDDPLADDARNPHG